MSKNEIASEVTFGGHLRQLISEGALDALREELKKHHPKSAKEKLLGEIRLLEQKLGVEPRPYNGGTKAADTGVGSVHGSAFYGNGAG